MPQLRWSRLPISWILDKKLRLFGAASMTGESIAALKIYVAIVLRAENNGLANVGPNQGSSSVSYDELMSLTGISRPMIARGVRLLVVNQLIEIKPQGRGGKSRYFLAAYASSYRWGKIPNRVWYGQPDETRIEVLHQLSNRRVSDLNALKLYLAFGAFINANSRYAMIGYEKIAEYTGVSRNMIRKAISVLIEYNLVNVDREKSSFNKRNHPNKYEIIGL